MLAADYARFLTAADMWGIEPVMSRAEQEKLAYLFRLRMTANVKKALTRMMAERDWADAGQGWQGKETSLRLHGWSRQRRVVLLRRKLDRPLMLLDRSQPEQPLLSFAEVGPGREVWEYAALVTSLDSEILTLSQALPRPQRLRERLRRTEEPMGLGRLHDARSEALPTAGRHRRTGVQLVEPVYAPGRA